ncbi:MAG: PEGA domain protein [Microgenomates bacterium OLB23]|nr:MAG: PEGA domain protein [Microgenomates bacterium OLB23]
MRFIITRLILLAIFAGALYVVVGFARGYRLDFRQQGFSPTGILVASSAPDGAKILVNGELKGATNSSITVKPGVYDVEIAQDGYLSWKKRLTIKGELVIKADALLFPINPSLSPLTSFGVVKAIATKSHEKTILFSETNNAEKDGIYLIDNSNSPLARINSQKLLALKSIFPSNFSFTEAQVEFSPNEKQMLVSFVEVVQPAPTARNKKPQPQTIVKAIYLLPTDEVTLNPFDVTNSVAAIRDAWSTEDIEVRAKLIETFKKPVVKASTAFNILGFSPDETKILYEATQSATIEQVIKPPLIATNQTPEERTLKPGSVYIYDKKEDKKL